jgi:hypothetical protein
MNIGWKLLLVTLVTLTAGNLFAKDIDLVKNGKSAYSIYYATDAPVDIKTAAEDFQRVIKESTGADLPVVHQPKSPMICLGNNSASGKAGLDGGKLKPDAFTIRAINNNIYIVGNDTPGLTKPFGATFRKNHMLIDSPVNRGTVYGVYTFLDKFTGARWLMPGKMGEDIPKHESISIPANLNITETPCFKGRSISHVQTTKPEVIKWLLRNRTSERYTYGSHAWNDFPQKDILRKHPEYMALVGGRRSKPAGHHYKFCLSNPDIAKAFFDGLRSRIDRNRARKMHSTSPTDGPYWCECEECKKLYDYNLKNWDCDSDISRSPAVFKFANEVARLMAKYYPDIKVGCYAYAYYSYPPERPFKLESSVHIVMALIPKKVYGMNIYKPEYMQEMTKLVAAWRKITPNLSFVSYMGKLKNFIGVPLPVGIPYLKVILPALKKNQVETCHMIGDDMWGARGCRNYVMTKMMWDANADPDTLTKEWCLRAYGPGGINIYKMNQMMEERWTDFMKNRRSSSQDVTSEMVVKVYVPVWKKIEKYYTDTEKQCKTEAQKKRLSWLGDNLKILYHNLVDAGLVKNPKKSPFYIPRNKYKQFVKSCDPLSIGDQQWLIKKIKGPLMLKLWVPKPRSATIPFLSKGTAAPVIDGKLDDPAWKQAVALDDFQIMGRNIPATNKTTAKLLYDDKGIYIAFDCKRAEGIIRPNPVKRDDSKFYSGNDTAEVFFSYFPNPNQRTWHISINPDNSKWDGMIGNSRYNFEWPSATKVAPDKKSWTAEIEIPFSALKMRRVPKGRKWKINLCRTVKDPRENSTWSPSQNGYFEPVNFGTVTFQKKGK